MAFARFSDERYEAKRISARCAATKNSPMVTAIATVAAKCLLRKRSHKEMVGPSKNATAARMVGRRNAANESAVRSRAWDIDRVSVDKLCLASTVEMSGT